jgi:hypothetical protein
MERLAAKPTAGVPQACRGWGETMAAYRFFDNGEVEWSAILEPHWRQTEQRMAAQSVVLCLQDTTELDFNGRQAAVGGFLGHKGDGEPGAKAIWLGLKEVHVAAKTLQKLGAGGHAGKLCISRCVEGPFLSR